jgi:hypothetical protein
MHGLKRHTGRVARRTELNGRIQSASVTIMAAPNPAETKVVVADSVLQKLRGWFGQHLGHGLHCVADAGAQVAMAKVAGEMPLVGRTEFLVEVVDAELDSTLDWQESGWLLSMASIDAMAEYLREFEQSRSSRDNGTS